MFRIDDTSAAATLPSPEVAGVEGYWTEGNPATGIPATLERASWFNMLQEELRAIPVAAGIVPSKTSYNQVLLAIKRLFGGYLTVVNFAVSPFSVTADHAGMILIDATAGNVVINLPAVNVFAVKLEYRFVRTDATANTVTVNSSGANTFLGGATGFVLIGQGDYRAIAGDSVSKWLTTSTPSGGVLGVFRNYKAEAIGINNYNYVITADEAVLENSANGYITVRAVNKTVNSNGTVGAPLSIMSARAASTWYYPWLWYNATLGLTATLDISSTAPTAPTGYAATDYKVKAPGAVRTDGSGSTYMLQSRSYFERTDWVPLAGSNVPNVRIMATGTAGNASTGPTVALAVGAFVPPTAPAIYLAASTGGAGALCVIAPNNGYGGRLSSTNPCPMQLISDNAAAGGAVQGRIALESTNIYYAADGVSGTEISCLGWQHQL